MLRGVGVLYELVGFLIVYVIHGIIYATADIYISVQELVARDAGGDVGDCVVFYRGDFVPHCRSRMASDDVSGEGV